MEIIPAASWWTLNLKDQSWTKERYWSWNQISSRNLSFDHAVDKLADSLRAAVEKKIPNSGALGISLSGGLDSRTILSLIPPEKEVTSYTFGMNKSLDVQLAKQVALKAGVPNQSFPLSQENWWDHKLESIWRSDGMKNLIHLHQSPVENEIAKLADWNMNGFLGGIAVGGIYAGITTNRVSDSDAKRALGEWAEFDDPN